MWWSDKIESWLLRRKSPSLCCTVVSSWVWPVCVCVCERERERNRGRWGSTLAGYRKTGSDGIREDQQRHCALRYSSYTSRGIGQKTWRQKVSQIFAFPFSFTFAFNSYFLCPRLFWYVLTTPFAIFSFITFCFLFILLNFLCLKLFQYLLSSSCPTVPSHFDTKFLKAFPKICPPLCTLILK